MERVYITVKKSKEPRLPYLSKISGDEWLHYDEEALLNCLAEDIVNKYSRTRIIFRNNIPKEEEKLRKTLDLLVRGHNLALILGAQGQIRGTREARKILDSR